MRRAFVLAAVLAALAVAAALWLRSPNVSSGVSPGPPDEPTSLARSLAPLEREFNRRGERDRIVAVFSPSCPVCLEAAVALHRRLESRERAARAGAAGGAGPVALVIWTEVLPNDGASRIGRRLELFRGLPDVAQFHDSRQRAARAAAAAVAGWPAGEPLWDAMLFYAAGRRWQEALPPPDDWLHQHEGRVPERYRSGQALAGELGRWAP